MTTMRFEVGQRVYWNDPDDGLCSRYGTITAVYGMRGDGAPDLDPVVTLDNETDALMSELSEVPLNQTERG
jgi:hypothetical protein